MFQKVLDTWIRHPSEAFYVASSAQQYYSVAVHDGLTEVKVLEFLNGVST